MFLKTLTNGLRKFQRGGNLKLDRNIIFFLDDENNERSDYAMWIGSPADYGRWNFGNCFKTKEQRDRARDRVKEILLKIQKEMYGE